MFCLRRALLCAAISAWSVGLSAHHGFGSFVVDETIELSGIITGVDFVNPHAWVYFEVPDENGEPQEWRCEMRAATVLRRSGWSRDMFVPGEPIQLTASPDRDDSRSCYLSTVRFADGTTAERYGQLQAPQTDTDADERPLRLANGQPNISGDWAPEQYVMTDPTGREGALVPLSVARGEREVEAAAPSPWRTREVTLTPAGQEAADNFDLRSLDNPRMRCETTSIIFDWNFDGPVNRITQYEDRITLEYGQYGFTRTIHLDRESHPDNLTPTRAGHSIGRWEDEVLIVDTVGFAPGVLAPPVMNSARLHVEERFSLDADTFTLTREYRATDPVYFSDQYVGADSMQIADIAYDPDPCTDYSLTNYDEMLEETP